MYLAVHYENSVDADWNATLATKAAIIALVGTIRTIPYAIRYSVHLDAPVIISALKLLHT